MIKSENKFISKGHKGYNTATRIESLNPNGSIKNVIQIQVKDLKVALQIYANNENSHVFTIDRTSQIALTKPTNHKTKEYEFYQKVSFINKGQKYTLLDINATIMKLAALLSNDNEHGAKIYELFKHLEKTLNSIKKHVQNANMQDTIFLNMNKVLNQAKKTLESIILDIETIKNQSIQDLENRFSKDIILLSAKFFSVTHGVLIAHILMYKFGHKIAARMLIYALGLSAGPLAIFVSLGVLLFDIYDFFINKNNENEKIAAAYKLYASILCIYENLDYSLVSLLNLGHIGAGNLITQQDGGNFIYHLYPDYHLLQSDFIRKLLKSNAINFEDISYKASISINKDNQDNQQYLKNIFEIDNTVNANSRNASLFDKINTQFSTFSFQHLYKLDMNKDDNFTKSSAFCHLKNIFLKFDNFLFVKSSSFSSVVMYDLLLQSFSTSRQNNPARIHKTAIFLTNCLHNGLPEYKSQQYVKDSLLNNENIKKNILFLSAMYRVDKAIFVENLIATLKDTFHLSNDFSISSLDVLIRRHNVGVIDNAARKYKLDNQKIYNLDANHFFSFILDMCSVFLPESYKDIYNETNKNKKELQDSLLKLTSITSDISCLMSHFGAYDIMKIKNFQKEIDKEYINIKTLLNDFFKAKNSIFHNNKKIMNICIYVLDRYFYKNTTQNIAYNKLTELEQKLQNEYGSAYHKATIDYVSALLPLDKHMFLVFDEWEIFMLCRAVVDEISKIETKEAKQILQGYTFAVIFSVSLADEETRKKLINKDNPLSSIIYDLQDIGSNAAKQVVKEELKTMLKKFRDKYGIAVAIVYENSIKDAVVSVLKEIAGELDKRYAKDLSFTGLSKGATIFSTLSNSILTQICGKLLDKIFPTIIKNLNAIKQKTTLLLFMLNHHRDTAYATCKRGSKYLTFPIEIAQTLISADIKALILDGSPLNSSFCVQAPSIALFNENDENAIAVMKQTLKHFINHQVDFNEIGRNGGAIIKEAYAKLWFYLDMGENKELEYYLTNRVKVKPSYYALRNLKSEAFMRTKLKISKELDNSDKNFIEVSGDKKGGVRFNRDFLIQLKRIAEYNYSFYQEEEFVQQTQNKSNKPLTKISFEDELLLGNLIYDKEYIPTTIDIRD